MIALAGIDYSLTGPAIAIHIGQEFSLSAIKVWFLTDKKKFVKVFNLPGGGVIEGLLHRPYLTEEQRYDNIASTFLEKVLDHNVKALAIEDYAFAAKGKVFHIAENCGLLKWKLREQNLPFKTYSPNVLKQRATGKGNAKKEQMHEAFTKSTGIDLINIFQPGKSKCDSPLSDIVDAFWIVKCLHEDIHLAS